MSERVMSKEEMEKVLSTQMYGMLALTDGDKLYCIPLPFTYTKNAIYVGFFPRGRIWKYIQNNNACFCTWEQGKGGGGSYSVIVEGKIVKVTDLAEIKLMLEASAMKRGRDTKWIEERI